MHPYPPNSPEATARLVALSLVADGRLDPSELEMLRKVRAFERIGLGEERFLQVLHEFCHDLLRAGAAGDAAECRIDNRELLALLGELDDPRRQKVVLRLMLDVIRADGKLHKGESMLFWQAIEHWRMRLSDIARIVPRGCRRFRPATHKAKRTRPQPTGLPACAA